MTPDRVRYEQTVTAFPDGRVVTRTRQFGPSLLERVPGLRGMVRSKPKSETLRDNNRLIFPPHVLRSLRTTLPETLAPGGEDEEIYKTEQQQQARFTVKDACLELIVANQGKEISTRRVAEQLVRSNKTYQNAANIGRIDPVMEEGWYSDVDTTLSEEWPTVQEVANFLNARR